MYAFLFFDKFYVYRSGLTCMCSCLRVSFTVTVLSYFVCATESKAGRQMEIKNLFVQRKCIIYALTFSPTKDSMRCEIQVQIEK